ncbi:MAG: rod shape-determining protein RodA [Caldisericaceae bacterium]
MRKVPLSVLIAIFVLTFYSLSALYVINAEKFFLRQIVYTTIGIIFLFIVSSINFRVLKYYTVLLYVVTFILLISVFLIGVITNGARRWINLFGLFSIQPSEFAKITLILMLIWIFEGKYTNFKKFVFGLISIIPFALVVFFQPDMGTSLVYAFIFFIFIAFFLPLKYSLSIIAGAVAMIPFLPKILKPYQIERILTFFNPYRDPLGSGYNVLQSMIAFGSGRLSGNGFQKSLMTRLGFVPVQYADFIFSAIGEIWGFIGVIIILFSFLYLFYFIVRSIALTGNKLGKGIALGVFAMFLFQVSVNMGMNIGIMPVTGIPLPFLSFGGSSTITNFIALGLVVSVYNFKDELSYGERL